MFNSKNIVFKVHVPLEFLYSMFAVGTNKHFYTMIREFDLEPNDRIIHTINEMKKGLSRYMEQELEYFFDLPGLGYILYKYILQHPELTEVPQLLQVFNKSETTDLAFNIVKSVCKNNMPKDNTKEYEKLKYSTSEMLKLVEQVKFQDKQRRDRVIEALQNPEETKQRFYLLLSQFYSRCFNPIESDIITLISAEKEKYEILFNKNPQKFMEQYFNLDSINNIDIVIHLSFFKYISWHHYSIYSEGFADWFILGIYSNLLFDENLSAERLSNFFKAVSDPNRIEILKLLSERPWFGQELAEKLNITPATISYHMAFLQKIGAVTFNRADNRSYYCLNNSKLIKPFEEFIKFFKTDKK